ncbi:tetratricopeptide repeat protein [Acidithiobacillus concretivorus]|nr:tetratricopeptide repeat protein [Acidithiobacillus concretivorus]
MIPKKNTLTLLALVGALGLVSPAARAMTSEQAHQLCLQARAGNSAALSDLTLAAQKGNRSAENWLGVYYGLEHKYSVAVPWTRKAALQGDPLAEFVMGSVYYYGNGVAKNPGKAVYWLQLAVDQGFQKGEGMLKQAQEKLKATAANSHPSAPASSAATDSAPANPPVPAVTSHANTQTAQTPARKPASTITVAQHIPAPKIQPLNPSAENQRGYAYYSGQGQPQNYAKAVYWFRKAALQGNASAENNLGVAYNHGQGVPKNLAKAFYWYQKAAQQGNPSGETNLGVAYYEGDGTPSNTPNALHWWKLAANQGDQRAQSYLSVVHLTSHPATS